MQHVLLVALGGGLGAACRHLVSLWTLKTTGCGLPAGPFGLIGAAEGISYLVVIGFVAAALLSKVTSGKGLPAGPGGLLGAAEGLSFLTALAGLAVLGFQGPSVAPSVVRMALRLNERHGCGCALPESITQSVSQHVV